ncbi:helix-turn-helix domain-containing protein [Paludicola sp. MB14-C6]|uniref:helix-turn-helix domain-containing protein n=1 Tax=Paludihabitans sp. MB14-C6 TaxID=3070656 RepID=UPI0027DD9617|nr:helix-turn-helix domain-containing protein [Paludicola sp. MB14-C6]WMJ21897.1 helix-turn-helix domain-containing protein [Paludicola sp. MB14-C6]
MVELDKLYTVDEIATMTSLTTRTIRNYLRNGILKGRKLGGQWRFTTQDIQNFMNSGEVLSEMAKEQKQSVLDFIDGVNTDMKGNTQICTIADLYVSQSVAKEKCDQLCNLICSIKDEDNVTYKYDYVKSEEKARFIVFASPNFIIKVMNILK